MFGPGFTANLDGPDDTGLAGLTVIDNTAVDGTLVFADQDGEPLVYQTTDGARKTGNARATAYVPVTQDTIDADTTLTVIGTGTGMTLTLTEADGTTTSWKQVPSEPTEWVPDAISEPGLTTGTRFGLTTVGKVSRVVAAVPVGVDPATCTTGGTLGRGCRAMKLTYATATTATTGTPGDYAGQVKSVSATLWDPATASMRTVTVAEYGYDQLGRLRHVTDPRTGLGTACTWDGASTRIASVKDTGTAATYLSYAPSPVNANLRRLTQVERDAPTGSGSRVTVARVGYDVPTTGAGTGGAAGLPDLAAGKVAAVPGVSPDHGVCGVRAGLFGSGVGVGGGLHLRRRAVRQ